MTDQWLTQKTLVERAKDPDDHEAWDDFAKYYKGFIRIILKRLTFRESDYDDLEQDILLAIWKSIRTFDIDSERAKFRTWLTSLIRNTVLHHLRTSCRYEKRSETAAELFCKDNVSESELAEIIQKEWKAYIGRTALDNVRNVFSGLAIQVFELSLKGKTSTEIAQQLDIKQSSARTLKHRVKQQVIKEIARLKHGLEF